MKSIIKTSWQMSDIMMIHSSIDLEEFLLKIVPASNCNSGHHQPEIRYDRQTRKTFISLPLWGKVFDYGEIEENVLDDCDKDQQPEMATHLATSWAPRTLRVLSQCHSNLFKISLLNRSLLNYAYLLNACIMPPGLIIASQTAGFVLLLISRSPWNTA